MTYDELLARGRKMTEAEARLAMRKLLANENAAALIAWLEDFQLKGFVTSLGSRETVDVRGRLEHCAGSIHAVQKIQEELQQFLVEPAQGRPRPTE